MNLWAYGYHSRNPHRARASIRPVVDCLFCLIDEKYIEHRLLIENAMKLGCCGYTAHHIG